jgi:anti-sigma factor RsiW
VRCSRARRELLEHVALGEALGSRSGPLLSHLDACADCRWEVGSDRALVENLRRALGERVDGYAPSEASWGLVRQRTVDRPARPWTARLAHWGGMVSAAGAAAIMMFAVATAPETRLLPETQSPFIADAARRAVPAEEAAAWKPAYSQPNAAAQAMGPLPGWPTQMQRSEADAPRDEPEITRTMR